MYLIKIRVNYYCNSEKCYLLDYNATRLCTFQFFHQLFDDAEKYIKYPEFGRQLKF